MTDTDASLAALAAHTQTRRDSVDTRTRKALKDLRRERAPITLSAVAHRAKVGRNSIYRRPELLALIRAYQPLHEATDAPPPSSSSAGPESSIVAALRSRLTAKDTLIADLRTQLRQRDTIIAALQGELERLAAAT